jgi:serine/threonine protein kinase
MSGQLIGHYRVLEKIGSGAMGEVFRARDERLGRDVALKFIRQSSGENPDHLRRFELEARAAAALNHPNIVAVYDVGSNEGTPYIVCELLEGETLRTRLSEGALPVKVALDYALQMVHGLISAHDRRIVHRDLKPENLFLTTDGRVKILDFGVAKLQPTVEESGRSAEQLTTVTKSGTVIGTVAYMSPEQLRGKAVDHRSDIFSVGTIIYEMLTASRAFRGETEVDTITAVLREEPAESNLVQAKIPVSFQQIVKHCLEKEPESRFQSARDLAFALETLSDASGARKRGPQRAPAKAQYLLSAMAGALVGAAVLLLLSPWHEKISSPSYQRLTFEKGTVYSARFTPNFRAIVYAAAWNGKPPQLFSTVGDSPLSQPLNLSAANLLAISRNGDLAVLLGGEHGAHLETSGGMLARAPLAGGSPREILENVSWADWDANGEMAIVHQMQGQELLEYPIGHVLYRTPGWLSHIRLSQKADKIAFFDHPEPWDDGGSVKVVDLNGHPTVLSSGWESEEGLAWSPDANEIWFSAIEKGTIRELLAVSLSGQVRKVLALPACITLEDVAPDGRVLVSLDAERLAMATSARNGKAVDISWHDWDTAKDLSPDDKWIMFEDASENAGNQYAIVMRNIDGSPPVQLGTGRAGRLSPDGKWAISMMVGSPGQIKLLPTGAGQPRTIPTPDLEEIDSGPAHFLGDGKHIVIYAREHGHGVRCYVVDLDGGSPVPITPEGIYGGLVSPNGKFVIQAENSGSLIVRAVGEREQHPIPNLEAKFNPLRWTEDSTSVYVYQRGPVPTDVYKVNVSTGEKALVQELQPETNTGVVSIAPVVVSPDGSRFAYSYYQVFSQLDVISGLR